MPDFNDESLGAKIDVLIRLQAAGLVEKFPTQRDKIAFLSRVGLGPKPISEILGTTPNSVSVALSKMKKGVVEDGSKD